MKINSKRPNLPRAAKTLAKLEFVRIGRILFPRRGKLHDNESNKRTTRLLKKVANQKEHLELDGNIAKVVKVVKKETSKKTKPEKNVHAELPVPNILGYTTSQLLYSGKFSNVWACTGRDAKKMVVKFTLCDVSCKL